MPLSNASRPTIAKIDLDNLAFNLSSVREFIGDEAKYMAVVKADAYGHGAAECSRRLEAEGIDWLGVALPEEGVELRNNGIKAPILCLGSFWQGQEPVILDRDLTPVIYQLASAAALNAAAGERNATADIHVKIDTGMGRLGVRWDEVREFAAELKKFSSLRVDGLMTHFASADDLAANDFTDLQISRFYDAVAIFEQAGSSPTYLDLANSPGAIAHPNSRGNMVRLGGILYGLGDDILPKNIEKPDLNPVLSLRSRVSNLKKVPKGESLGYGRTFTTGRDSLIAAVPIGYHDGYPRQLSNRSRVIVNGVYAPVVGTISMDWTLVDVSDVKNVQIGDEVILIGGSGSCRVTAEDLAGILGTISYEITCGISRRVPKIFHGSR